MANLVRSKIPSLTKKRINWLLKYVFCEPEGDASEPSDLLLLKVIRAMQLFNLEHRKDECNCLYSLFLDLYSLEGNSEGTSYWLAMTLAIKDLYCLNDETLVEMLTG